MTNSVLKRIFWLALCNLVACSAADRIDPGLRTLALTTPRLHVLIFLTQQPQHEIVRQTEESMRVEKEAARQRVKQLLSEPFSLDQDVKSAREDLDRITVETRRTAFAEIQRTIQPQQDRVTLLLRSWGADNVHGYTVTNAIRAVVPSEMLPALEADADIAHVSPVMKLYPQLKYSVPDIFAPTFWSAFSKGTGESVGVLDSGIEDAAAGLANPGFSGVTIVGHISLNEGSADPCFGDDASTFADVLGHGTHVSGIVGNRGGGSCPTCIGVAPGLDTLYALKIGWLVKSSGPGCHGGGAAEDGDVIDAIDWAVANTTVNVFNFSYGGPASGDDDSLCQVLDQIGDAFGVNIAIAAGNKGTNPVTIESPGISYNGVTVGSVDDQGTVSQTDDVVSSFSSRGPTNGGRFKPDITAPGEHGGGNGAILSTCISSDGKSPGDYCQMAGTSMATPHAAGALALIRSAGATSGLAAKAILLNSAYTAPASPGWNANTGWGFVDMNQASTQVANEISDSITAAGPKYYAGNLSGGKLTSTLVWNRHVSNSFALTFSNLDLFAYDGGTGNTLGSSTSTIQNVEQVVASSVNTAVLKVLPVSIAGPTGDPTSETYALAVSGAGFTAKNGPSLSVACTGPSGSVLANATFSVPCTVTNNGDLTAFAVSGTLNWQGSSGGTVNQFGSPGAAQQSGSQSWQLTAPATPGPYTLAAAVSSTSYGQPFSAQTTVGVTVVQSYTLTTAAVPSIGGTVTPGGIYAAGTQVCLTATPNSGWVFTSWSGATLDQSNCLVLNADVSVTANFVSTSALRFIPMTPCRVVDTRNAAGPFGGPSIAGNGTRSFTLPEQHLLHDSHHGGGVFAERDRGAERSFELPDHLASRRDAAAGFDVELAGWADQSQCRDRGGGNQWGGERVRLQRHRCHSGHRRLFCADSGQSLSAGLLSADSVPGGRYALLQLWCAGSAIVERGGNAHLPHPVQRLQCAGERAGVLAELYRCTARGAQLHHHFPHGPDHAAGLHAERSDWDHHGQCGHRAGGDQRVGGRVQLQRDGAGDRYQWVFRAAGDRRIVVVQSDAMPGAGFTVTFRDPAIQRREGRERDRKRLRRTSRGPGLCLQCHGGSAGRDELSHAVAAGRDAAIGINAERTGRSDHLEHGHSCPLPTAPSLLLSTSLRRRSSSSISSGTSLREHPAISRSQ